MRILSNLAEYLYIIPAVLLAITVHEFSHGYVAYRLGDPSPRNSGRLTLNPLAIWTPWAPSA
jgi:Zn-dependent protease